jgi:hypothetical protein
MKQKSIRRIFNVSALIVLVGTFIFVTESCHKKTEEGKCPPPKIIEVDTQSVYGGEAGNNFIIEIKAEGTSCSGELLYSIENGRDGTWQSENIFENVDAGAYIIAVKDENDTVARISEAIVWEGFPGAGSETEEIVVGDALHANIKSTNETCEGCNDGKIVISATGGTPPYQFSVDKGKKFIENNSFSKLAPGSYSVQVKDSEGKIYTHTIPVIIDKVKSASVKIPKETVEKFLNDLSSNRSYDVMDSILTWFESNDSKVSGQTKTGDDYTIYMYTNRLMMDGPKGSIKVEVQGVTYNDRNQISGITIKEK